MKVTIDRFEGDLAVCEKPDRTMVNIAREKLPSEAKEGDILLVEGNNVRIDLQETERRKKRINKMMDDLWK